MSRVAGGIAIGGRVAAPAGGSIASALVRGVAAAAVSLALLGALGPSARASAPGVPDTLRFLPLAGDSLPPGAASHRERRARAEGAWLKAPYGDRMLTDLGEWRARGRPGGRLRLLADYNRVDQLRIGLNAEYGLVHGLMPRVAGRIEYSDGRNRALYGAELEQPLVPSGRFAVGGTVVRRTDHPDLQQVEDLENTLAVLLARNDYRDYFDREGGGLYVRWRIPGLSTLSLNAHRYDWRSLPVQDGTRSWFHQERPLRVNPTVDEGQSRSVSLRLERLAPRSESFRAGLYHWIDAEWAGGSLGGDFEYSRVLVDLRGILRLSPATTLALRGVGGATPYGTLTAQKEFTLGAADGLRAHEIVAFRGNRVVLGQAEYTIGLWRFAGDFFEGGIHAIAFVDAGTAWSGTGGGWDPGRQHLATDGGFGLGTSEDNLRLYLARNLQDPGVGWVLTFRLQRPF